MSKQRIYERVCELQPSTRLYKTIAENDLALGMALDKLFKTGTTRLKSGASLKPAMKELHRLQIEVNMTFVAIYNDMHALDAEIGEKLT